MSSLGSYLKRERERRHVSVAELAQTTRIPVRVLRYLENDEHEELPADVFVRGFLKAYARALGLDEAHVLARYRGGDEEPPAPALPAVYAPESGRRFGIAIVLVILLILFTLALSIVLRPRHRDAPRELSHHGEQLENAPVSMANLAVGWDPERSADAVGWDPERALPGMKCEQSTPMPSCFAVSTTARPTASSHS